MKKVVTATIFKTSDYADVFKGRHKLA